MKNGRLLMLLGAICMLAGLIWLAQIPYFFYRSDAVGQELLARAKASAVDRAEGTTAGGSNAAPARSDADDEQGPPAAISPPLGWLTIPSLQLEAPILSGTDEEQIAVAVGHFQGSAALGTESTALLAAHNATYFRHIDRLKRGDEIQITTSAGVFTYQVTGASVAHAADGVVKMGGEGLVLMTCYPLDALRQTEYRYLVYATAKKPRA
ncbi:class D sortase [Tumebacillus lipolyticus]|uniref:Class D sortase n=1 Tax=Tumebacillus lipolyticus TaxID=1280370 RepID=A0ABW4ZXE8_9BACL